MPCIGAFWYWKWGFPLLELYMAILQSPTEFTLLKNLEIYYNLKENSSSFKSNSIKIMICLFLANNTNSVISHVVVMERNIFSFKQFCFNLLKVNIVLIRPAPNDVLPIRPQYLLCKLHKIVQLSVIHSYLFHNRKAKNMT